MAWRRLYVGLEGEAFPCCSPTRPLLGNVFRQDFFALPTLPYHADSYDLILEYTFFCAISPSLRPAYVKAAGQLLKKGGVLAGLFFPLSIDKPGPPFVVSEKETRELFEAAGFDVTIEKPQSSVKPRAGREFLGIFRKK